MAGFDRTLDQLIDTYCAAWSSSDPAHRRLLLSEVLTEDASYIDPTVHTVGIGELLGHIDIVLARRPGAKVERTSRIDAHHGFVRFAWHVVQADGTALPDGLDLVELSDDGRIQRIVGFFGPL
ncbi:hypothetical protein JK358_28110 [Nocardia sp. 2]|uniref:Nuclear transport factor 2 family protein n=1 Tax=Nocardia acididurans TaxID=2802282 RepID=A0ABS1MGD4_9NOCA|nr:hypothetical protein [Nocardia acididurans]MBL1078278.1 hypothetical protein [Nocardia acididurans]